MYHYCSFDDIASQQPQHVIGSFLAQLSNKFPDILQELEGDYDQGVLPATDDLLKVLSRRIDSIGKLYVFLDGLNESGDSEAVLKAVLGLLECSSKVRLMLTATAKPTAVKGQNSSRVLDVVLDSKATNPDIAALVSAEIERREVLACLSQPTKERVKNVLLEKADGM